MLPTGPSRIPNDPEDQRADAPRSDSDPSNLETVIVSPSQVAIPQVNSHALQVLSHRYDILAEAGRGAMGQVYKARDRETGETVALKILKVEISSDPEMIERFKSELLFARKITHKNVCRVHEFNRVDGVAYTSMEFVQGESLRSVLKRFGSVTPRKGVDIASQMCSGLKEAHAQGIVHRDLKPENVMIDTKGNVKIMDFGIARSMEALTLTTGALIGTPAYMAPEQAAGKPVDQRSDIYALGLMLYEMFTGLQAFRGDNAISVALKQMNEAPRPPREIEPAISPVIEMAILRCLEKDPEKRFQSVAELESALLSTAWLGAGVPDPAAAAMGSTHGVNSPAAAPVPISAGASSSPAQRKQRSRILTILLVGLLLLTVRVVWRHLFPGFTSQSDARDFHLNTPDVSVAITNGSVAVKEAEPPKPLPKPETKPTESPSVSPHPAATSGAANRSTSPAKQRLVASQAGKSPSGEVDSPGSAVAAPTPPAPATFPDVAALDGADPEPPRSEASTGGFIWVNRFPRQAGAQNAAKKIEGMGLPVTVIPRHNPENAAEFFVVLSGPFPKPKIEGVLEQLKNNGFPLARLNRVSSAASPVRATPN